MRQLDRQNGTYHQVLNLLSLLAHKYNFSRSYCYKPGGRVVDEDAEAEEAVGEHAEEERGVDDERAEEGEVEDADAEAENTDTISTDQATERQGGPRGGIAGGACGSEARANADENSDDAWSSSDDGRYSKPHLTCFTCFTGTNIHKLTLR